MRADVQIREEWRAGLMNALREEESRNLGRPVRLVVGEIPPAQRRWSVRPYAAVAAGLALFTLGAATAAVLTRSNERQNVATPNVAARTPSSTTGGSVTAVAMPASANTAAGAGSTMRFMIVAPAASRVSLVGDFNLWNPRATPMRRLEDGRTWVADVPLDAGRHVYAFVVDGGLKTDPAAPRAADDDFGVPSSVVTVPRRSS
jgi:hypothetical protein